MLTNYALSEAKAAAFRRLDGSPARLHEYRQEKRRTQKQVRVLLNNWWAAKAATIQHEVDTKSPNHQFAGYKELLRQVFVTGRRPGSKLRDKDGRLLETRDALTSVPEQHHLAALPTFAELLAAVSQLRAGKAHGPDGVQPELIQALSLINLRILYEFVCRVWDGTDPMPEDWKANYLVPLPKSGDLTNCGRWRGILLSSVPSKVFSRILNGRLQTYLEAASRAGRGTADMIFTLRMALEIARRKSHPLYILFVDLAKAYDSVSRVGLWELLKIKGVPPQFIRLLRDFYSGKEARISAEGVLSCPIQLNTGLGQGGPDVVQCVSLGGHGALVSACRGAYELAVPTGWGPAATHGPAYFKQVFFLGLPDATRSRLC